MAIRQGAKMVAKRDPRPDFPKPGRENSNRLQASANDAEELQRQLAQAYTLPNVNAAILISGFNAKSGLDLGALAGELHKQFREVHEGDLSRVEAMLLDQAHALQALFTNLASRAQGARYLSQHQTYMQLALKAQNQCRQTLAALAEIKNPRRTTVIGQQNNATNQQVNNAGGPSGIRKNPETRENELLEAKPHERLDTGTAGAAIGADRAVETVGALNRS